MTAHNLSDVKDYDNGLYSEQQITVSGSERLSCWSDPSLPPFPRRAPPKIQARQRVTGVCLLAPPAHAGLDKWQIVGILPSYVCDIALSGGLIHFNSLEAAVRFCWVVWHCEGGVITFWSSQAPQCLCKECCHCPPSCRPQPQEECPDIDDRTNSTTCLTADVWPGENSTLHSFPHHFTVKSNLSCLKLRWKTPRTFCSLSVVCRCTWLQNFSMDLQLCWCSQFTCGRVVLAHCVLLIRLWRNLWLKLRPIPAE